MEKDDGAMEEESAAKGTTVILGDSEFGEMIYDDNDQAIYVFERDTSAKSTCYDECAAAWPPVVTSDQPIAGEGVDAALLGTTKRRDGSLQVTYDGRPLYYAHEGPGEVRCHNVDLNGGFWWVVGADGSRSHEAATGVLRGRHVLARPRRQRRWPRRATGLGSAPATRTSAG